MAKTTASPNDYLLETLEALAEPGCLLVSQGADGRPNAMAIGWATFGIIWGRPVLTVLVRHSRHTWKLLQENPDFTVNVPTPDLAEAVMLCGTRSGRDLDKIAAAGLTLGPASRVSVPIIHECIVHYECRTLHRNNVEPTNLAEDVLSECYARGDFHTLYFGQILAVQADEDARQRLH